MSDGFVTVLTLHSSKTSLYIDETAFCVDDQVSAQHSQALHSFLQLLVLQPGNPLCLVPYFLGIRNTILEHTNFAILGKQIPTSAIQSQHFLIFFIFLRGRGCVDCLLNFSSSGSSYVMLCYVMYSLFKVAS